MFTSQELPAVFLWRALDRLVTYDGYKPWSKGALSTYTPEWRYGPIPVARRASERWAAYVRSSDNWGVGLYFPRSANFVSYAYGPPERASEPWSCVYLAPYSGMRLEAGERVEYNAWMYVGQLEAMRAQFYEMHANPAAY
jgi:hypothetical protein